MYTKSRSKSCSNDTNLRLFSPVIRRLEDANHHLDAGEKKRRFLRVPTFDSLGAAAWDEGFQMLKRLTVFIHLYLITGEGETRQKRGKKDES